MAPAVLQNARHLPPPMFRRHGFAVASKCHSRDACWQADQPQPTTLRPCLPLRDRQTVAAQSADVLVDGYGTHTRMHTDRRPVELWSEHAFRQAHQNGNSTNRRHDRRLADIHPGYTGHPARRMSRVRRSLSAHDPWEVAVYRQRASPTSTTPIGDGSVV